MSRSELTLSGGCIRDYTEEQWKEGDGKCTPESPDALSEEEILEIEELTTFGEPVDPWLERIPLAEDVARLEKLRRGAEEGIVELKNRRKLFIPRGSAPESTSPAEKLATPPISSDIDAIEVPMGSPPALQNESLGDKNFTTPPSTSIPASMAPPPAPKSNRRKEVIFCTPPQKVHKIRFEKGSGHMLAQKSKRDLTDLDSYDITAKMICSAGVFHYVEWNDGTDNADDEDDEDYIDFDEDENSSAINPDVLDDANALWNFADNMDEMDVDKMDISVKESCDNSGVNPNEEGGKTD